MQIILQKHASTISTLPSPRSLEEDRQRRAAEKARLNAKLRETHALNVRLAIIAREKREAARRAAAERAREKASRKKAAVNPLQALWDANGAEIYEANKAFKTKYGKNMSAKVRRKAIKDATRNGHFNAGAYAGNLVKAVTPPPPNPYAAAADRIRAAANEIDDEKKIGYVDSERDEVRKLIALNEQKNAPVDSATRHYMAMGAAVEAGKFSKEEYDKARKQAENNALQRGLRAYYEGRKAGEEKASWWEKPRNWGETIVGLIPTIKTAWKVRNIDFVEHAGEYLHIQADAPSGKKLDEFANAASEGWEHGAGGNYAKETLDNEVAKWVWEDGKGVFGNIKSWFSPTMKRGEAEVIEQVAKETSEEIAEQLSETAIKEAGEELAEEAGKLTVREVGGEILENTAKSGPWDILVSTAFNVYDYGFGEEKETGILSQEFAVSTGVDITQSIITGLAAAGVVALAIAFTPLSLTLAGAALVAGVGGALLDIGLNIGGVTNNIKMGINSWIDSLQE